MLDVSVPLKLSTVKSNCIRCNSSTFVIGNTLDYTYEIIILLLLLLHGLLLDYVSTSAII